MGQYGAIWVPNMGEGEGSNKLPLPHIRPSIWPLGHRAILRPSFYLIKTIQPWGLQGRTAPKAVQGNKGLNRDFLHFKVYLTLYEPIRPCTTPWSWGDPLALPRPIIFRLWQEIVKLLVWIFTANFIKKVFMPFLHYPFFFFLHYPFFFPSFCLRENFLNS